MIEESRLQQLMVSFQEVTGLRICLHSYFAETLVAPQFMVHHHPACVAVKKNDKRHRACIRFDGHKKTHREMLEHPGGRIQTCPFGITEIVAPIMDGDALLGVLFAGACVLSSEVERQLLGATPVTRRKRVVEDETWPELIKVDDLSWLQTRLDLLGCLAFKLSEIIRSHSEYRKFSGEDLLPRSRREIVLEYINERVGERIELSDIAGVLGLSVSRAGHLVKEMFGMTVPALVNNLRMRQAAFLLTATDLPISDVAREVGFDDQGYFTRIFKKNFPKTPNAFRRSQSKTV